MNSFMATTDIYASALPIRFGYEVVRTAFKSLANNVPILSDAAEAAVTDAASRYGVRAGQIEYLRQILLTGGEAPAAINPHPVPCHICKHHSQQGHKSTCTFFNGDLQ
jgi:hypothetical protein